MPNEVNKNKIVYFINEDGLLEYLVKNNLDYTTQDITSLVKYIINIYIAKYPSIGHKSKDLSFHIGNLEKGMNEKQRNLLKCNYQNKEKPLCLKIEINDIYRIAMSPIYIEIDPNTGIVDDFSIMCLTEYYEGLCNNITIEELYNIMKKQNNLKADYTDIENYLQKREQELELRKIIISYITDALKYSDPIESTGEYRSEMFIREFNSYYNIPILANKKIYTKTKTIY